MQITMELNQILFEDALVFSFTSVFAILFKYLIHIYNQIQNWNSTNKDFVKSQVYKEIVNFIDNLIPVVQSLHHFLFTEKTWIMW